MFRCPNKFLKSFALYDLLKKSFELSWPSIVKTQSSLVKTEST
jgi:hypothetical protein